MSYLAWTGLGALAMLAALWTAAWLALRKWVGGRELDFWREEEAGLAASLSWREPEDDAPRPTLPAEDALDATLRQVTARHGANRPRGSVCLWARRGGGPLPLAAPKTPAPPARDEDAVRFLTGERVVR